MNSWQRWARQGTDAESLGVQFLQSVTLKDVSRPDGRDFLVTSLRCAQTRRIFRCSHVPQWSQCSWRRQASDPMMAPYSPPLSPDAEGAITAHTVTSPRSAQQAFRFWLGLTRLLKETRGRKKKNQTHLRRYLPNEWWNARISLGGAFWAVILENRIMLWTLAADMEILVDDWHVNVVNKMYYLTVDRRSVSFPSAGLIWNQFKKEENSFWQ